MVLGTGTENPETTNTTVELQSITFSFIAAVTYSHRRRDWYNGAKYVIGSILVPNRIMFKGANGM